MSTPEDLAPILVVGDRVRHRHTAAWGTVLDAEELGDDWADNDPACYFVRLDDGPCNWIWQGYLVKVHPLEELALEAP